jgi:hypothetical protein
MMVNHSHTWAAGGWDCRVNIVTDQSDLTIDMFGNRASGTLGGQSYQMTGTTGEFELQHRGFLTALERNDPSVIRSTYADALRSFHVAARINQAVYGQSAELDIPEATFSHAMESGDGR